MNQMVAPHTWTRLQPRIFARSAVEQRDGAWLLRVEESGSWMFVVTITVTATWWTGGVITTRLELDRDASALMTAFCCAPDFCAQRPGSRSEERLLLRYKRKWLLGHGAPEHPTGFNRRQMTIQFGQETILSITQPSSVGLSIRTSGDIQDIAISDAELLAKQL